jgi:hypothetical protein
MMRNPPPGLQVERTGLAWERTAVGAFATAVLLALRVHAGAGPAAFLPAAAALALALGLTAVGRRRMRACERRPVVAAPTAVLVAGACTAALGVLIGVLALL